MKRSISELLEITELRNQKKMIVDKDGTAHIQRSFTIQNKSGAAIDFTKDQPYPLSVREETLQITHVTLKDQTGKPLEFRREESYGAALLKFSIDDKVLGTHEEYKVTFEYDYQNFATNIGRLWVILEPYSMRSGAREGEQYSVEYYLPPLESKFRFWEKLQVVAKLDGSEQKPKTVDGKKFVCWSFVLCPGGEKRVQITYGLEIRERLLAAISATLGAVFSFIVKEMLDAALKLLLH